MKYRHIVVTHLRQLAVCCYIKVFTIHAASLDNETSSWLLQEAIKLQKQETLTILSNMVGCSELSSGIYCRVKWLSTYVSEVHHQDGGSMHLWNVGRQSLYAAVIPEDNSEHHTRRRENLKSHDMVGCFLLMTTRTGVQTDHYCIKYQE
jgi:hypothetical protein